MDHSLECIHKHKHRLTTQAGALIRVVTTIIRPITEISLVYAQMIATFKFAVRAIPATRKPWRTVHLITHVSAVSISIAAEVRGNAVPTRTLECPILERNVSEWNINMDIHVM